MRYYLAFRRAIPQQKVGSCRSSPVCHWIGLAASPVRLACLRYTASIHPEPGSNSQLKLNFKRHSLPLSKWQKIVSIMHPVHNWLLHLLKSFAIVTTKLTFGKYKTQLPKEEIKQPREHEYFTTPTLKSNSQPISSPQSLLPLQGVSLKYSCEETPYWIQ